MRLKTVIVIILLHCVLADIALAGIFGRGRRRGRARCNTCPTTCAPGHFACTQDMSCRTKVIATYFYSGNQCAYKQYEVVSCAPGNAVSSYMSDCDGTTSSCTTCTSKLCFSSTHDRGHIPRPPKFGSDQAVGVQHHHSLELDEGSKGWIVGLQLEPGYQLAAQNDLELRDGRWVKLMWILDPDNRLIGLGYEIPDDDPNLELPRRATAQAVAQDGMGKGLAYSIVVHAARNQSRYFAVTMRK